MKFSTVFIAIISVVAITSVNAFASPKMNTVLHRHTTVSVTKHTSSTTIHACLDGIMYESTQPKINYDSSEMYDLCLINKKSNMDNDYIYQCLMDIVGLNIGDAYEVMAQYRKGLAGASLIDDFPREEAEYYYEQLTARGIPVGLWGEEKASCSRNS